MNIKSVLSIWFPMWFPDKALKKLEATPDRLPELLAIFAKDIKGLTSGCMTLLEKIQKIERRLDKLEKGK